MRIELMSKQNDCDSIKMNIEWISWMGREEIFIYLAIEDSINTRFEYNLLSYPVVVSCWILKQTQKSTWE